MTTLWIGFFAIILVLLALDLGVFHRKAHSVTVREATGWSLVWVTIGLSFNVLIYLAYEHKWFGDPGQDPHLLKGGWDASIEYLTGYLLEKSLSVDNIFVIAVLINHFRIAPQFQHRVLFWGILGAIVTRGIMIVGGVWLIEHFDWIFYVFGAYLVWTGGKLLFTEEDDHDPTKGLMYRFFLRMLPVHRGEHDGRFTVRLEGKRHFTDLFLVLLIIEGTDVIFALDSIPAILAITEDPFIVMTSNIFAILGLRSLYFVLVGAMQKFHYLRMALGVILVFIGLKMALHHHLQVPNLVSLAIILLIVVAGIFFSVVWRKQEDP